MVYKQCAGMSVGKSNGFSFKFSNEPPIADRRSDTALVRQTLTKVYLSPSRAYRVLLSRVLRRLWHRSTYNTNNQFSDVQFVVRYRSDVMAIVLPSVRSCFPRSFSVFFACDSNDVRLLIITFLRSRRVSDTIFHCGRSYFERVVAEVLVTLH